MSTKHGSLPALVLRILTVVQSISKLAFLPFQRDYKSCVTGLQNITVLMSAWNQPASTGFLFLISWRRITSGLLFLIPNTRNLKKTIRLIVKMPDRFVIYICVKW